MKRILPVLLLLTACQTEQPTVQNQAATRAALEGRCASMNIKRNTPEFYNCVAGYEHIEQQQAEARNVQTGMVGAGAALTGLSLLAAFSDERLKRDIVPVGQENGFNVYRFRYVWSEEEYIGVIAQEVRALRPDAVFEDSSGYLKVNYGAIGVAFRRAELR